MQGTRLAITIKKREIRKKLLLAKTRTARRFCWFKKSRTDTQWENFIANKIPECREKGPISRPYLEKLILVLY